MYKSKLADSGIALQGRVSRQYTPSPGFLLVSNPVQAGWLERSAVLITHTSLINGSQGLVLNRQIHTHRQEDAEGSASETDDEVSFSAYSGLWDASCLIDLTQNFSAWSLFS